MKQLAAEEYLLMHFRALPPDRQRDLMDQAANLYKRYGVAERVFPYLENETKDGSQSSKEKCSGEGGSVAT